MTNPSTLTSTVVVIDGPQGSGKTGLARALVERWDRPLSLWDLGDRSPYEDGELPRFGLRSKPHGTVMVSLPDQPLRPGHTPGQGLHPVPALSDVVIVLPTGPNAWFTASGSRPGSVERWLDQQRRTHALALITTGESSLTSLAHAWRLSKATTMAGFPFQPGATADEQINAVMVWQQRRLLMDALDPQPMPPRARTRL